MVSTIRAFPCSRLLLLLLTVFLTACAPAQARHDHPPRDWDFLGERRVNDRAEHDVIHVGRSSGSFTGLKLAIDDAPVLFRRIEVHFGNGERMVFGRDRFIGEHRRTGTLDLPGGHRIVSKVVFFYEAASPRWEHATVRLWGRR